MKTKSFGWDVVSRLVIFLLALAGGGEVFAQTGSDYWQYSPTGVKQTSSGYFTLNFETNIVTCGGNSYTFAYLQLVPGPPGNYKQNINGFYYVRNTPWVPPALTMFYNVTNNSGYSKNFFVKKNNTIIASGSVPVGGPHAFGPYTAVGMDVFQFWNQDWNIMMDDSQLTTTGKVVSLTITPGETQKSFKLSINNKTGQSVPVLVLFSGVGLIQQGVPPGVSQIETFGDFEGKLIQVMEQFTDPVALTEIVRSQFGSGTGYKDLTVNAVIQGDLVPDDNVFGDLFPHSDPPRILDNSDLPPTLFHPGETVTSPVLTPDPKPDRSALPNPTTASMTKNDFYDIVFDGLRDTLSSTPTVTNVPSIPLVDKTTTETYRNETMTALDDTLGKLSQIVEKGADVMKNWAPEFVTYDRVPTISWEVPWREQGITIDFDQIPYRWALLILFKFLICILALVSAWKLVSWSLT